MRQILIETALEKLYDEAGDEFVKLTEPVVKGMDFRKMTDEDFLLFCRNAFEAGCAKGVSIFLTNLSEYAKI